MNTMRVVLTGLSGRGRHSEFAKEIAASRDLLAQQLPKTHSGTVTEKGDRSTKSEIILGDVRISGSRSREPE